jgi:hypothetical protein|tara:strand:- start:3054 stop:4409 length:1356 start_codon:yes stop_codon:yes gene_type:complete
MSLAMRLITNALARFSLTTLLMPAAVLAGTGPDTQDVELPSITPEITKAYQSVLLHVQSGDSELAVISAREVVDQLAATHGEDSELLATPVIYLGLAQLGNHEAVDALNSFGRAVELIETSAGPFDPGLVPPLQGIAMSHMSLENYDVAASALRRAQHVTHRHKGVYNADQLAIVDKLIEVDKMTGKYRDIERQELFYLKVHEDVYGKADSRILPALQRLGEYMAHRAAKFRSRYLNAEYQMRRKNYFKQSFDLYQRAIRIVEENYGDKDLRLIEPLRGLALAKLSKGFGIKTASESLRRVVDVVKANPGSDVGDIARATVDLGDLYTRWNDGRATEAYREAWNAIPDEEIYQELRDELFGTPVRLVPTSIKATLPKRPWRTEDEIFTDLEYVVRANGRAARFQFVDGNLVGNERRNLRSRLRNARFRPRVVDGEVVRTEGMILHQQYEVR